MIGTDINKQHARVGERRSAKRTASTARRRRTDREAAGSACVIPFPAEPALHQPTTEQPGPHILSLPLREALREAVEPVLRRARAANELAGFLVLELDSYREIEETFGHELAEQLSERIKAQLVEAEVVDDLHG